jgi:hypothetical protein
MTSNYLNVFLWGLLVFASYIGYGELIKRLLKNPKLNDVGWGIKASLGLSLTAVFGGALMVFRFADVVGLTFITLIGCFMQAYFCLEKKLNFEILKLPREQKKSPLIIFNQENFFIILLFLFAAFSYATSVAWPFQYDPNDDWVAYLTFPEKILQTGTLIEPFSQRRIMGLCGQSLLQAQIMIVGEPENGQLLDKGFGMLLLFGLMLEATRAVPMRWQWLRFLVILVSLAASVPRINTASGLLGVALMMALLVITNRLLDFKLWSFRVVFPLGLLLACISSLRPTFAMVGGLIFAVFFIWRAISASKSDKVFSIIALVKIGAITFLLLLPYMISSWESSRTLMFPFMNGNASPEYIFYNTKKGILSDLNVAFQIIAMPEMAVMALGLLLAGMLPGETRRLAISAASVALFMALLSAAKTSGTTPIDMYRYTYPIFAFAFFWIIARCVAKPDKENLFSGPVLAGIATALFMVAHLPAASNEIQTRIASIPQQIQGFKFSVAQLEPEYRQLQNLVPVNERIFAIVDAPYLLDYKRNKIENMDHTGYASPFPGIPSGKGADELKRYLTSLGFRYILAVDFDYGVHLYSRKIMEHTPRPEFRKWGRNVALDIMNNLDKIGEDTTIARAGHCRLLKIQ